MDWINGLWQLLSRDVAVAQGFHSPLLSWLGAVGILGMFLWYSFSLFWGWTHIRQAFRRACPAIAQLVHNRKETNKEWIVIPSLSRKQSPAQLQGARRDLDDLHTLDRVMRSERIFAADWLSYRKAFSIEQPSWFIEPTVHTGRSAGEFFPLEHICADTLDVRFFQQLPSIITGIGLMFTFLAILIGLSKLHANGSHIEGIQGLINGLAGKFITSIVGLACANLFAFLEKSLFYRLTVYHRQFLSMLDEMFPQKVHDHGTPTSLPTVNQAVGTSAPIKNDSVVRLTESLGQRLGATVTALTAVSESLSSLGTGPQRFNQEELSRSIGSAVQKELTPLFEPLHEAIRELSRSIETMHTPSHLSTPDMERLLDTLKQRLDHGTDQTPAMEPGAPVLNRLSWILSPSRKRSAHEAGIE